MVITGSEFISTPTVYLGNTALGDVQWVSATRLKATVPWGLEAGVYTLTVANPGGETGSLSNAFTVTQAISTWTADGPFRSGNGGDDWQVIWEGGSGVYLIGVAGDLLVGGARAAEGGALALTNQAQFYGGGVYQLTLERRPASNRVYLPLVVKN